MKTVSFGVHNMHYTSHARTSLRSCTEQSKQDGRHDKEPHDVWRRQPRPTQFGAAGAVHGEDVVAVFASVVHCLEGEAVAAETELGDSVLTAPVGVALGRVGEEPVVLGTDEVLVHEVPVGLLCQPCTHPEPSPRLVRVSGAGVMLRTGCRLCCGWSALFPVLCLLTM